MWIFLAPVKCKTTLKHFLYSHSFYTLDKYYKIDKNTILSSSIIIILYYVSFTIIVIVYNLQ
jgi:hypothetical protein